MSFRSAAATAIYTQFISAGTAPGRQGRPSSISFALAGLEGTPPAVVHLIPVVGDARDIFSRAAYFMILTPADRSRVPSADIIKGLFDLTPAEARIAASLARGSVVGTAAQELGLAAETVRTHVKSILSKSGMTRQSDFVAAVASIRSIEP